MNLAIISSSVENICHARASVDMFLWVRQTRVLRNVYGICRDHRGRGQLVIVVCHAIVLTSALYSTQRPRGANKVLAVVAGILSQRVRLVQRA